MLVEAEKFYLTRGGHKVFIGTIVPSHPYPARGIIVGENAATGWALDGRYWDRPGEHRWDLISEESTI